MKLARATLPLLVTTTLTHAVRAEPAATAAAGPPGLEAAASGGAGVDGPEARAELRAGLGRLALGGWLAASHGRAYPDGRPDDDVTTLDARAAAWWTPHRRGRAALELSGAAGPRRLDGGGDPRWAVGGELGMTAVASPTRDLRVRLGLVAPVAVAAAGVDEADQQLRAGLDVRVGGDTWLTVDVHGGGAYGYDGDGAKLDAGAQVGVRVAALATGDGRRGPARAFVATEWRALGVGDHLSHGPGFAVGALLLGGHLRLGLAGFSRPGPINPRTFATTPVDGQTWNGQARLDLRSDGNFLGLHVAPTLRRGPLSVALPLTVGQAAFGFYLHGADRAAVMGERVSAVENRLFAGKDSSFALGAEAGLELGYALTDWLAVHGAVHCLVTAGYDTIVRDDYGGPSAALGVALTP